MSNRGCFTTELVGCDACKKIIIEELRPNYDTIYDVIVNSNTSSLVQVCGKVSGRLYNWEEFDIIKKHASRISEKLCHGIIIVVVEEGGSVLKLNMKTLTECIIV